MAKGFGQVQDVDYFQTSVPTPSSASVKILAAVANKYSLKIFFHVDVAQAFVSAKLDHETLMKLPDGCGDIVRKDRSPQRVAVWSKAERTAVGRTMVEVVVEDSMDGKVDKAVHVDDIVIAGSDETLEITQNSFIECMLKLFWRELIILISPQLPVCK